MHSKIIEKFLDFFSVNKQKMEKENCESKKGKRMIKEVSVAVAFTNCWITHGDIAHLQALYQAFPLRIWQVVRLDVFAGNNRNRKKIS